MATEKNKEEMEKRRAAIKATVKKIHDKSLQASYEFVDFSLTFSERWKNFFHKAEETMEETLDDFIEQVNTGNTPIQKMFDIKGVKIPTVQEIKDSATKLEETILEAADELVDEITSSIDPLKSKVDESIKSTIEEVDEVLDVLKDKVETIQNKVEDIIDTPTTSPDMDKKEEPKASQAKASPKKTAPPKTKKAAPKPKASTQKTSPKATIKVTRITKSTKKDVDTSNLKLIKGIGPKLEELLKEAGVNTLDQIASMSLKEIRTALEKAGKRYTKLDAADVKKQAKKIINA